jgi:hypothetical protein
MDTPPATFTQLEELFGRAVSAIIALGGIILFVMLVMGGIKYITSGGDPKAAEGAKHTITYAVGGLVLVLLSFLILVIIGNITGADLTNFTLVQP